MNVNINSVHFKVNAKLEDFINAKINKLSSLYDGIIGSEVGLKLGNAETKDNKIVDVRLLLNGYDLIASKQAKTFEEAADDAIDAIRKQLIKRKEKQKTR
jgi:putative sigma-54 modulation protein